MNQQLKPFKYDVYCYYRCENCGAEVQQSEQEVKSIGKFVCYGCNSIMKFDRISEIKVSPKYIRENKPSKMVITDILPVAQIISGKPPMNIPSPPPAKLHINSIPASQTKPKVDTGEKDQIMLQGLVKLGFNKQKVKQAIQTVNTSGVVYSDDNELFKAMFEEARK